jgi:hypothetical protein
MFCEENVPERIIAVFKPDETAMEFLGSLSAAEREELEFIMRRPERCRLKEATLKVWSELGLVQ